MKKTLIIIIAIIVVLGGFFYLVDKSNEHKNETIKIGIILPLTGQYGHLGENVVKGIELAKEEYLKKHPGSSVELIAEDDVLEATKGLNAYKKFRADLRCNI
jgi:ABC-type branched-subunit amino acid transport system substrate-binding protein